MDDKARARASSDGPIVDLARKLIISMGEDHYCIDDAQGCVYSPGGCRCVSKLAAALAAARQEAFEECAKIAERYLHTDETIPAGSIYWLGTTDAANGVAAAIRAASIQEPTDAE